MAITIDGSGTATISATTAGPGGIPYINVTGSFTSTNEVMITVQGSKQPKDIHGPFQISYAQVDATTGGFYLDRELPAGEEIVFRWLSWSP